MKIAILASGNGEKATYLHNFFKEGNRVTVDSLLTDNPEAPITQRMQQEGIDVFYILPGQEGAGMAEILKGRDVELIVVDDFSGELPKELTEAFGNAIVYPTSVGSAPLEVIQAGKKTMYSEPEPPTVEAVSDLEKEWSEALGTDAVNAENPETEPASSQTPPPEYSDNPAEEPAAEPEPAQPQAPRPFGYSQPYQQPGPQYNSPFNPYQQQQARQQPQEPMPDTYLVWSVIITILCCLIPGIVAIVYSASVSSKYYAGDIEGAKRASRNAQIWCIVSILAGIIWATLYIPLAVLLP